MVSEERTLMDEITVIHKLLLIAKEAEDLIQDFKRANVQINNSRIKKMEEHLMAIGCPIDDLVNNKAG